MVPHTDGKAAVNRYVYLQTVEEAAYMPRVDAGRLVKIRYVLIFRLNATVLQSSIGFSRSGLIEIEARQIL